MNVFRSTLREITPEPVKALLRPFRLRMAKRRRHAELAKLSKCESELRFWRTRPRSEAGKLDNSHFKRIMLAMAGEETSDFITGKFVADFGCGPRGSLVWATSAALRIGIDVLADVYADEFTDDLLSHGTVYVKSTERVIPLPSNFVDVMFTLNAIDHVDHFAQMCNELVRVLKPGGLLIGSFNLEEPASKCEPQQLNEDLVKEHLLDALQCETYRVTAKPSDGKHQYSGFLEGNLSYVPGQQGYLWVRAKKPG